MQLLSKIDSLSCVLVSSFYIIFCFWLVTCTRLNWPHSAFQSTLNSLTISYRIVRQFSSTNTVACHFSCCTPYCLEKFICFFCVLLTVKRQKLICFPHICNYTQPFGFWCKHRWNSNAKFNYCKKSAINVMYLNISSTHNTVLIRRSRTTR